MRGIEKRLSDIADRLNYLTGELATHRMQLCWRIRIVDCKGSEQCLHRNNYAACKDEQRLAREAGGTATIHRVFTRSVRA